MEIHKQNARLYIDGNSVSSYDEFRAETQIVALLSAYCRTVDLDVIIVTDNPANYCIKENFIIPRSSFKSLAAQSFHEIPSVVQDCQLPAIVTSDQVR